jgi:formate dehydrogenase subunit gamma
MRASTRTRAETLRELLDGSPTDAEYLLPVLQQVQRRFGFVSTEDPVRRAGLQPVARRSVRGRFVHGDLREEPVGDTVVQLCMAEACQPRGDLARHAESSLGVTLGQTTPDGRVHLEAVYCLGNCALGPSVRVGDVVYGGVSGQRFDELMGEVRAATARSPR